MGLKSEIPGAWISYTPSVDQGVTTNIAKTINFAKYQIIGKTIFVTVRLTLTANGTAGTAAQVSLPFGNASNPATTFFGSGTFFLRDVSTNLDYKGPISVSSSGNADFRPAHILDQVGWGASGGGGTLNLPLGTGDIIAFSAFYEVA